MEIAAVPVGTLGPMRIAGTNLFPSLISMQSWFGTLRDTGADDAAALVFPTQPDEVAEEILAPAMPTASVAALVGLAFEARIAATSGVLVLCRDAAEDEMSRTLALAVRSGCRGLISFGVAGGLVADLRPGDCIVASSIVDHSGSWSTDPRWSDRLLQLVPDARPGKIVGVNAVVSDPPSKRELHRLTGAVAVDMESHLVARIAAAYELSCATLRVVIDPVHRTVPRAATAAVRPGGCTDLNFLVRELVRHPSQVPGLLRIAGDACVANYTLLRLARILKAFLQIAR